MGFFSNILDKLGMGSANAATVPAAAPAPAPAPAAAPELAPDLAAPPAAEVVNPIAMVDVVAQLEQRAAAHPQKLNWRTSIVDLLKLLHLDSSLTARKQLAEELHYTGDTDDSATMNVWLHKQVVQKLAENGGKVPDDLKD